MARSTPSFRFRAATPDDVPAMVALEAASFTSDQLAARNFRRFLHCGNCTLDVVVEAGGVGRLAGYVLVLYRANSAAGRIYSIVVDQRFRGLGLGEKLLARGEEAARDRGRSLMRLEVRPDNAAALSLYGKLGYRVFGEIPGFYEDGSDALRLEKTL